MSSNTSRRPVNDSFLEEDAPLKHYRTLSLVQHPQLHPAGNHQLRPSPHDAKKKITQAPFINFATALGFITLYQCPQREHTAKACSNQILQVEPDQCHP